MLNRGLGGASVQNVIRVCNGLSITVEDLLRVGNNENAPVPFYITDHEKKLLTRYRERPEMKPAIDTLLGIAADK